MLYKNPTWGQETTSLSLSFAYLSCLFASSPRTNLHHRRNRTDVSSRISKLVTERTGQHCYVSMNLSPTEIGPLDSSAVAKRIIEIL